MLELTAQSFSEVYDIINHFEKNLYDRIPQKFIELLKENSSSSYISKFDFTKSINEQEISKETRSVLAIIYRDFICSKEKREQLKLKDQQELKNIAKSNENFNYEDLFKNKNSTTQHNQRNYPMEVKKENFFTKIINFIKKCFNLR